MSTRAEGGLQRRRHRHPHHHPKSGETVDPGGALGSDLLYAAAIPLAFVREWIADALYVAVALIWLAPDRRIEARLREQENPGGAEPSLSRTGQFLQRTRAPLEACILARLHSRVSTAARHPGTPR